MSTPRQLARIFKALGTETRLQIVQLLKDRALCVNALAAHLGVSAAAVSQHLRVLRDADLVEPDRRGCFVHYRIREDTLKRWKDMAGRLLTTGVGAEPECPHRKE